MLKITFPDGKHKKYESGITGCDIATDISLSLSKQAVAILVNGDQKDLSDPINEDALVNIITTKDELGLEIMRHTTAAQVLARAIKNIYPEAKLAIGPTIENGFYYDVLLKNSISSDDLSAIEDEMKKIVKEGHLVNKQIKNKNEAIKLFEKLNEPYKVQIINDSLQENDFQIYQQGETNFFDLCKGPHLPNLKFVGEFKLTKVSGAYWRGDSKNEMLQRIYGTAWRNKKELDSYLFMLKEAEKRDHRKIGKEMDLFHFQDDAPGSVFWHSKGWLIFNELVNYMRHKQENSGYTEISTPTVLDRSLWEKSGHWEKFQDNMYLAKTNDEKVFALKPMNCPGGIQIYNNSLRSYRDLPLRIAEFGKVFRFEPSGALHGLMRVREFTQDDAHIYCLKEQMEEECKKVINLTLDIYKDFGFENVKIKFADRPKKRIGDDDTWDFLEKSLLSSLKNLNLEFNVNKGEGAFYGPKIEFVLVDAIGREWQCGTLQVDLNLPPRLGANFIDKDGSKKHPVMLHRAFFGSLERFIGILIENYAGRLPNWLAPVQVAIATVNDNCIEYSKTIANHLSKDGIKFKFDFRNEKLNYKIRELSLEKVPHIAVIGEKEIVDKTVSLRSYPENNLASMQLKEFLKKIKNSCSIE
jgi:threonyl-tRNA synthetase